MKRLQSATTIHKHKFVGPSTLEYRIIVLFRLLIFQIFSNPSSLFQSPLLLNLDNLKSVLRESVHCSAQSNRNRVQKYKEQFKKANCIKGVTRAIKVGGINENYLATPSSSLKICHYPLPIPFSHRF